MANPKLENGYTRIPNELLNAIIQYRVSGLQKDILLCIIRQNEGFNKTESKLSVRFIAKKIDSSHARVSEGLKVLIKKNIVIVTQDNSKHGQPRVIMLNKDYETWKKGEGLFDPRGLAGEKPNCPEGGTDTSPEAGNNINTDIKNKIKNAQEFELFWKEYPRKVAKKKALLLFSKLNLNDRLIEKIMNALRQQKESDQWQNLQFVPHPATWLSQERWNDEIESVQEVSTLNIEEASLPDGSKLSYTQKHLITQEVTNAE